MIDPPAGRSGRAPEPDLRAGKMFHSYAMPEMLQNSVLKNVSSGEAIETAAKKLKESMA